MSLSTLNYPPLVSTISAGAITAALPILKSANLSLTAVKALNAGAYAVSLYAVMQPGRYDGGQQDAYKNMSEMTEEEKKQKEGMEEMAADGRGKTLLAPAGWAFSIWGAIFLGELVFVTTSPFLVKENDKVLSALLKQVTPPFLAAHLSQILWTATFRPKYGQGFYKYVSALNLAGIALGLSRAHAVFAASRGLYDMKTYLLFFLPMSLHFGWTTAASLVNLNGMFAREKSTSAKTVAALGHLSVAAATALGVTVTKSRSAPVFGGVIAWALAAVASGMSKRLADDDGSDGEAIGIYGASTQKVLAQIGSTVCIGVTIWTATNMFGKGRFA